jgi:hypothetical protein
VGYVKLLNPTVGIIAYNVHKPTVHPPQQGVQQQFQHLPSSQQAKLYLKNLPLLYKFHKLSDPKLCLQTN